MIDTSVLGGIHMAIFGGADIKLGKGRSNK